jgi:hypothetical protein
VTGDVTEAIAAALEAHQPDMDKPCWANERFCKGCGENFHLYLPSGWKRHRAEAVLAALTANGWALTREMTEERRKVLRSGVVLNADAQGSWPAAREESRFVSEWAAVSPTQKEQPR